MSVEADAAAAHFIEARQEVGHGRLAATALADEGHELAFRNLQVDASQDFVFAITEMHVLVFDAVFEILDFQCVFFFSDDLFGIQNLEDAFRRGDAFLDVVVALRERFGGRDDLRENDDVTDEVARVDAAIAAVRGSLVSGDAWRSLIVLLLGFAVIFVYLKGKLNELASVLILAGIVLVDMYTVNKRYIDSESFTSHYELSDQSFTPRPADAQIMQDKDMNYRVMDVKHFGEAMPSYFHKSVGGYHAAKLSRYNDLINNQIAKNNIQVLNMLNTRYVIVDDQTVQRNPDALGNAWFVDSLTYVNSADEEMAFLDNFNPATSAVADAKFREQLGEAKASQPGDTIYETSYAPNHLTYKSHSTNGGLAVFSEVYFPWGWKVTVDGKPVEMGRVNYVLRALQLPAGDHEIDFKFDPDEVNKTQTWATVAVVVIYLLLLLALNYALFGDKFRKKEVVDKE